MLQTMQRLILLGLMMSASLATAQGAADPVNERIVVVPMGDLVDAGQPAAADVPVVGPDTRTIEALPPPIPPPAPLEPGPVQGPATQELPPGPGAMIDGHRREGAFLSGPGSITFLMHHTLMTGLGVLATQMIPRAIDASPAHPAVLDVPAGGCPPIQPRYEGVTTCPDIVTGEGARLAYLTGTLIGAGLGFTSAAVWQFNHWMSHRSANFGILTSVIGGLFMGGLTDLLTKHQDAYATAWLTMIGSSAGAWLAAIVGGGDIPLNHATLVISGGVWGMIYSALIVAIVASVGGNMTWRNGLDAVMIVPALGAGVMALATLKFNPSAAQIMRANIFGVGVGGVVLVLSGLLLGPATAFTRSPVPYILSGVTAIGAKTLVSLLWADAAADSPSATSTGDRKYRNVWW